MKLILIVLIGAVILAIAEGFLSVKFEHWYDRIIFHTLTGTYGMVVWIAISKAKPEPK